MSGTNNRKIIFVKEAASSDVYDNREKERETERYIETDRQIEVERQ